jgi:hypothetical protein
MFSAQMTDLLHDQSLPSRYPGEDAEILASDAFVGSEHDMSA